MFSSYQFTYFVAGAEHGLEDRDYDLNGASMKISTPQKGQAWWDQRSRPLAFIPSRYSNAAVC